MNLVKSSLLGINLNDEEVKEFAGIMICSIQNWPISYLRLPSWGNPKSVAFWEQVVKLFQNRPWELKINYYLWEVLDD